MSGELTPVDFKPFIHGNYDFVDRNGFVGFCKFSKEQTEYLRFNDFFRRRAFFSSSVTLEFYAPRCKFSFDYKIVDVSSKDTLDVFVNGKAEYSIKVADMPDCGSFGFSVGEGNGESLSEIVVYFPIDADFAIKNFAVDAPVCPVVRSPKVLWLGDSISQGYGTFFSGGSFVNVVRRKIGFEVLNQGIGGYYYDAKCLMSLEKFIPDRIIVAFGTNLHDWRDKDKFISEFYEKLNEIYAGVKTLSISPLKRFDSALDESGMEETRKLIEYNCKKYGTEFLSGENIIPPEEKYFIDGLHPNAVGAEIYADKVVEYLTKIEFFTPLNNKTD